MTRVAHAAIADGGRSAKVGAGVVEVGGMMRWVAVLMLAVATVAAAEPSPEQLFRQLGLFGTWAVDCKRAAAPDNPHVSITTPSPGLILEDHDLGLTHATNRYSVLSAERLSDARLSVEVIFQPGKEGEERQKLVWAVHDGTLRTLFNQPQGGAVRVRDGVVVDYDVKTPTLRKCE
jgi:hypothetical protein